MTKSPMVCVTGFNTKMQGSFLDGKGTVKCGRPWTTSTETVVGTTNDEDVVGLLESEIKTLNLSYRVTAR